MIAVGKKVKILSGSLKENKEHLPPEQRGSALAFPLDGLTGVVRGYTKIGEPDGFEYIITLDNPTEITGPEQTVHESQVAAL